MDADPSCRSCGFSFGQKCHSTRGYVKLSTNKKPSVETVRSRPKPRKNEKTERFPALSNREAIELQIRKLIELGRLEDVDVALLNLARSAASMVDDNPTPSAVKEYAAIIRQLSNTGKEADSDFSALIDELRTQTRDS